MAVQGDGAATQASWPARTGVSRAASVRTSPDMKARRRREVLGIVQH